MPKQAVSAQKPVPAVPKQAPEASISASGDVEITGAGSVEDARDRLSHSLRELEAAQQALSALQPSDTVRTQASNPCPPHHLRAPPGRGGDR